MRVYNISIILGQYANRKPLLFHLKRRSDMSIRLNDSAQKNLDFYCREIVENSKFDLEDYDLSNVKRGLRNPDGTGVTAGVTNICNVEGYYIDDNERRPREGKLRFRGINMRYIVEACEAENRFGYEEIAFLLIFGRLPNNDELAQFTRNLGANRELPQDFIEDMIMKAPSPDIMNKMARSVLALYSYDDNPDETSVLNILTQCMQILAKMPEIMGNAYQVKRRHYYRQSMSINPVNPEHTTAQAILSCVRSDGSFTDEEAKLLDTCLMVHAEHGGGNNSTFATRVLSSSGTDTYSAIAAGIGALKGPRHGGANIKVAQMIELLRQSVGNINDEGQVADYLTKVVNKEAGDGTGLIYGMGHAVYTLSDPRAVILKARAEKAAIGTEFEEDFNLLRTIEKLTPEIFYNVKKNKKPMCANVDLYSGLIYKMLGIPEDLYTPIFTVARIAGWSAHRMEEVLTGGRIIRPAYKNVIKPGKYIPIDER